MQPGISRAYIPILVALHQDITLPSEDTPLAPDDVQPMVDSTHPKDHGYTLKEESYLIGRHPDKNQIVVALRRITISGVHARLDRHKQGYLLSDCESKNGTYVNGKELGKEIEQPYKLEDQDEIGLGPGKTLIMRFLLIPDTATTSPHLNKISDIVASTSTLLTRKELEVLALLASGLTQKEIARELFISSHTVNTHLKNIYSKLSVKNKNEAIDQARREGLI